MGPDVLKNENGENGKKNIESKFCKGQVLKLVLFRIDWPA